MSDKPFLKDVGALMALRGANRGTGQLGTPLRLAGDLFQGAEGRDHDVLEGVRDCVDRVSSDVSGLASHCAVVEGKETIR